MENIIDPLSKIETFLKVPNTTPRDIEGFLISILAIDNFYSHLEVLIPNKEIFFLRHAHSLHNDYLNKKEAESTGDFTLLKDPELSEQGIKQCIELNEHLHKRQLSFDVLFISPSNRTLRTLENTSEMTKCCPSFLVTELVREKFTNEFSHTGKPLEVLKKTFPSYFNWEYVNTEEWWNLSRGNQMSEVKLKEKHEDFTNRILLFFLWIILRGEKKILMLSHSKVYKLIHNNSKCKVKNGEITKLKNSTILGFIRLSTRKLLNYKKIKNK